MGFCRAPSSCWAVVATPHDSLEICGVVVGAASVFCKRVGLAAGVPGEEQSLGGVCLHSARRRGRTNGPYFMAGPRGGAHSLASADASVSHGLGTNRRPRREYHHVYASSWDFQFSPASGRGRTHVRVSVHNLNRVVDEAGLVLGWDWSDNFLWRRNGLPTRCALVGAG